MKKMILMLTIMLTTAVFASEVIPQNLEKTATELATANKGIKELTKEVKNFNPNSIVQNNTKGFMGTVNNGVGTVYGDGKEGVTTLYNDIKSMAPDAKSAISEIYSQIKKISSYTWNLLVKQQKVWAWCFLISELMFLFVTFRFWSAYNLYKKDLDESGTTKSINILPILILGVASLILGYFSFIHFEAMMTGFINPEFGALRNLLEMSKSLK